MVALAINGLTIPVLGDAATQNEMEVGTWARSFSGKLRRNRRALKRTWALTTAPMLYGDAQALEGMLLARGEQWPGDTDAFSAKGMPPLLDNGISVVTGGGKFGNALWPRGATVNMFSSNVATGTDTLTNTTGFRPGNPAGGYGYTPPSVFSAISSDSAQHWQGSRALKCVVSDGGGPGMGVATNLAVAASTTYTFSFYIRSAVTVDMTRIGIFDQNGTVVIFDGAVDGNPYGSNGSFRATTDWTRHSVTFTTRAGSTAVDMVIGHYYDTANTLWIDGMQMEPSPTATTWGDGGFAGVNTVYDVSSHLAHGAEAVTLAAWLINPAVGGVAWTLADSSFSGGLQLSYYATNTLAVSAPGGVSTVAWDTPGTYTHVAVVALPKANLINVYLNGTLAAYSATAGTFSLGDMTRLHLGNAAGTSQWLGYVDELLMLPYAASAAQLQALAAGTVTPALQPNLRASGDMVGGIPLPVIASDVKCTYLGAVSSGAFRNNMAKVDFTLNEV